MATRKQRITPIVAGLVLAQFNGLLFQVLLDPGLAIEGERMQRGQTRLLRVLPDRTC